MEYQRTYLPASNLNKLEIELSPSVKNFIDDNLIDNLFNTNLNIKKDKNQRKECGCVQSVDIGVYNTCSHGCTYCYATFSEKSVEKNKAIHNPNSPMLIGNLEDLNNEVLKKLNSEQTLF
jgi:2-iminoacetate synthase ThiH